MTDRLLALRLFIRVARTGNFSRAARELGMTQPTASRTIQSLEHDLGASLLTRTTRAVTLTEAGSDYLLRVETLLDGLDQADHEVRGSGELRGILRVGLSSTLALRGVIPRLAEFSDRHPALRLELLMDDRRQDLVSDGVDVAIRFGDMTDSTAVARHLGTWPRVIVASPRYLAAHGTPRTPTDLTAHRAIVGAFGAPTGWRFHKDGREASVRLASTLTVTLNEGAIAASVAGLGIAAMTLPACRAELDQGQLVRLLPDWDMGAYDLHAVFASGRAAKPSARAFTDFLKSYIDDL